MYNPEHPPPWEFQDLYVRPWFQALLKMDYQDTHRTFLQTIMHVGIMSDYELQQTIAKIFNRKNSVVFYVGTVNASLEPLGMKIKDAYCEFTGEKYWMFMNTTIDDVNRFQTQFSHSELELLRKVFEEIITSADGRVSSLTCLNIAMENNLNKAAREEFLNESVTCMWLNSKDGCYYMGVRSIMELMPYFRVTYPEELNDCPLCKQPVFHGQRCEGCNTVAHLYCLAVFAHMQTHPKCSKCKKIIPTENLPESREPTINREDSFQGSDEDLSQRKMKITDRTRNRR